MRVLGVSFDSQSANLKFAESNEFPFQLLCDTERAMGLAFGACLDSKALFPARFSFVVGPTGVVELAIKTEDPGAQAAELLPELDRLTRAKPGV
ncbi:MAG: peroxiredoxin Q/BCP [Candidatus Paceibacteria bacterium]